MSAEAMQRMDLQQGPMTCSVWCLESSSSSRWPPLVPIQRVAALCTSRAFTRAQYGAASVGGSTSLPCRPLQPESCLQGEESSVRKKKHLNVQHVRFCRQTLLGINACTKILFYFGDTFLAKWSLMMFLHYPKIPLSHFDDDIHISVHGAHSPSSLFSHRRFSNVNLFFYSGQETTVSGSKITKHNGLSVCYDDLYFQ